MHVQSLPGIWSVIYHTRARYLAHQTYHVIIVFATRPPLCVRSRRDLQVKLEINHKPLLIVSVMIQTRFLLATAARVKACGHSTHSLPRQYCPRYCHTTGPVILDCDNVQVCESSESQTAILVMKRKKVNSFNHSFLEDFSRCIKTAENRNYNTLLISSSIQGVFSAGLDLKAVLNQSRENIEALWNAMQDAWIDLYSTRLLTIAAINGHCLAGGCVFAFSCDSRIALTGEYKIGITAARVGITAPAWVHQLFAQLVGFHQAEKSILQGLSFTPLDAYKKGMVDELSEGSDVELIENAIKMSHKYMHASQEARAEMKLLIRNSLLNEMKATKKEESNKFVDQMCSKKLLSYL